MKILHVFKTYYPDSIGGIEQVIFQLCEEGVRYGLDSEVFYLSAEPHDEMKMGHHLTHSAKLDLYFASTGFSLSAFKKFKILAAKADIVHYHFPWPYMDLLHIVCGVKKPTVLTYHSDVVKQKLLLKLYKPLMMHFLKSIDCIVATSPNYLKSSDVLNAVSEKVSIIPIGINHKPVSDFERESYWREKLPSQYFLFVGALRYYKGLTYLLEAQKKIDLPLVIIGDGPLRGELESMVLEYGLENTIFLGAVDDTDRNIIMKQSYAIVFPSHLRSEAFGITLVEGLMYGKPLISCEIGTGTSYINQNRMTGFVIPPKDAKALQNSMQLLWNEPLMAKEFSQNALKRYHSLFTADKMMQSYFDLYSNLLKLNVGKNYDTDML